MNSLLTRQSYGRLALALLAALIGVGVARYIADRQPACIYDIPIHPEAAEIFTSEPDPSGCSSMSYRVDGGTPGAIQEYYRKIMLQKGWLGGGDTNYPIPLLFVRKVPGTFQSLTLSIQSRQTGPNVVARLCDS